MGKPEGKRSLGRPRHRWKDNIKMDLREMACDPGDWIALAEDMEPIKNCTVQYLTFEINVF